MLPIFCPPTIWAISLEFYRKLSILAADDFLGACYRKAMTPKKLWTLLFPHQWPFHPLAWTQKTIFELLLGCFILFRDFWFCGSGRLSQDHRRQQEGLRKGQGWGEAERGDGEGKRDKGHWRLLSLESFLSLSDRGSARRKRTLWHKIITYVKLFWNFLFSRKNYESGELFPENYAFST